MKKLLMVVFLTGLLSVSAFADETAGKFGIGVKGGAITYRGDIANPEIYGYYNVLAQYWFTNVVGVAFNYGKGRLSAAEANHYFKTNIWNYTLLLKIKPFTSCKLNPYLAIGYEMFDIHPKGRNGWGLPNYNAGKYDKINGGIPLGVGFSYFLNEVLSLDAEFLAHVSTTDYVDDLKVGSRTDSYLTAAIGLTFNLGKPKDTDGDGIPDRIDKDPLHAEDFDHFQDEDGAPDLDNDQDGVPDKIDKAPLEPEDRDGYQDNDGVPDPDNDGDGILDVNDKAPNQPEDKDGFEDQDGVPDPDNDHDGIVDAKDKCPDQAETVNGYEDNDGCPDKKPEIAVEKGKAIVLEGINFASGSAKLTANSKTILDKVVRTLRENPEIEVEIRGYTDNTGSYEGNVRLSQKRAEAVRDYLIANGIEASRIVAKGYGPANPIADNSTPEGRAKNRRIEFYRIK